MTFRLTGLVAAAHTPFRADGALHLPAVEKQAEHLALSRVKAVFVAGTTGESHSLTVEERMALASRWSEVWRGTDLRLVVHVGANCLADARALASHAQNVRASAIAALAPSYFKPDSVDALVSCCREIAGAAPDTPFYFYDIPALTGVRLSMPDFLSAAQGRIPTLAGIKFTNPDLLSYQKCLASHGGSFDVPWGIDEGLLAALALGATAAVGSSYNFAAPVYHRMLAAFARGDMAGAREEQYRAGQAISLLAQFGYLPAAKAVMERLGIEAGPARLPHRNLTTEDRRRLYENLESLGFFDWIR